jgi:nitric oxide synthase-interacting protein
MGRHSKDRGDLFTYAERRGNGDGNRRMRLGEDNVRAFDHCCIGLTRPHTPVCCPSGYLFEREAIVAALLAQKLAIKAGAKQRLEAETARRDADRANREVSAREDARAFASREESVNSSGTAAAPPPPARSAGADASVRPPLTSHFWLPSREGGEDGEGAASTAAAVTAAAKRLRCPMSRKPLRLKDLRPVVFHGADASERPRFVCPVCSSTLSNASRPAVLASGNVLCGRCMDKTVGRHGRDPVDDSVTTMNDVVFLRTGGTSFAASGGEEKEAVLYKPSAR